MQAWQTRRGAPWGRWLQATATGNAALAQLANSAGLLAQVGLEMLLRSARHVTELAAVARVAPAVHSFLDRLDRTIASGKLLVPRARQALLVQWMSTTALMVALVASVAIPAAGAGGESAPGPISGTGAAKGSVSDAAAQPAGPEVPPEGALAGLPAPAAPAYPVPMQRGALPVGKGMWIWLSEKAEGGNPEAIVIRAQAAGLTHLYVRTASKKQGFYAAPFLDRLLPAAHAANIRVYAWDFPYLHDVQGDVNRALQAITHTTPDGHRVDGYAADIELRSMGVNITPDTARAFGTGLRQAVGANYPLIACVPRPSRALVTYPFAEVIAPFDAVAPMTYWLGRDPAADVAGAIADLSVHGKPVLPVGQAYDGAAEGGPRGVPPRNELLRFMQAGEHYGAAGVSWWSWQHADQEAWDTVRDAPEFHLPSAPAPFTSGQIRAYQTLLTSLGFPAPPTGAWDGATLAAVQGYQRAALLPVTGVIDEATRTALLTPFAPPIRPQV